MKKMQWPASKIIGLLLALLPASAFAQISSHRLYTADSLFAAHEYTQALAQYENIFNKNEYSAAMLLKMAYINEGLGRIGQTLYYLSFYHKLSGDDEVLEKMTQLSEKYGLEGYQVDDTTLVLSYYRKSWFPVAIGLAVVIFFLLSLQIFMRRRGVKAVGVAVALFVFCGFLLAHLQVGREKPVAIVAQGNVYLMEGPSGAAPVVSIINAGHRFEIQDRYDVWLKIHWKGKTAFIRENQLLQVSDV